MGRTRRGRLPSALGLWPVIVVLGCCMAAGCASAPGTGVTPAGRGTATAPTPARTTASGRFCASAGRADRLVVRRINHLPQNHERFSFPDRVIVSNPGKARAVAEALCALPPMPHGVFHCPAGLGIDYELSFAAGQVRLPEVTVDATGCEQVSGLGRGRWVARSPGFWQVLGAAMGLPHAGNATFSGTMS